MQAGRLSDKQTEAAGMWNWPSTCGNGDLGDLTRRIGSGGNQGQKKKKRPITPAVQGAGIARQDVGVSRKLYGEKMVVEVDDIPNIEEEQARRTGAIVFSQAVIFSRFLPMIECPNLSGSGPVGGPPEKFRRVFRVYRLFAQGAPGIGTGI